LRHIQLLKNRVNQPSQVPIPETIALQAKHVPHKIETLDFPSIADTNISETIKNEGNSPLAIACRSPSKKVWSTIKHSPTLQEEGDTCASCRSDIFSKLAKQSHVHSPTRYSAKLAKGVVMHTQSNFLISGDSKYTPESNRRLKLFPHELDKKKTEIKRAAKSQILSSHVNRIESYASRNDYNVGLAEENHAKATAARKLLYQQAFYNIVC